MHRYALRDDQWDKIKDFERYGHWKAVHRRHRRWCESGVFMRVFEIMSRDADNEFVMLDAIVRAHQHSAGAQKKRRGLSDRPLAWRTDDENPRGRRCARQPR
jgi:transposase